LDVAKKGGQVRILQLLLSPRTIKNLARYWSARSRLLIFRPVFSCEGSIIQYAQLAKLPASILGINAIMILQPNLSSKTPEGSIKIPEVLCYGDSRLFCTYNGRGRVFRVDFRAGQRFRTP